MSSINIRTSPVIRRSRRGSALLAVLWLTAALSAIAFSVANTVRGEIERTSTASDGLRSYYLATGGVERAILYIWWGNGVRNPDGSPKYYDRGIPRLNFAFPSGNVSVEIIPEISKLNINSIRPEDLFRLLLNVGANPDQAREVTASIMDWRTPGPPGGPFDGFYSTAAPSFRSRHASIEEIEELLLVKGMTPELFYGTYIRDDRGLLVRRAGLWDCVSVYGSANGVDANTVEPAVLFTLGLSPDQVAAIVDRRRAAPFRNPQDLAPYSKGAAVGRLVIGGATMFSLRSTAQLRLSSGGFSDLRRTVTALIKLREYGYNPPVETLRWYDN